MIGGPSIGPGEAPAERCIYEEVVLEQRLRDALARLSPSASPDGLEEAFRKLTRISSPQPIDANQELHHCFVNGIDVEYVRSDGTTGYHRVRVIDNEDPANNDWLVVNQFTIKEHGHTRCADIVVFGTNRKRRQTRFWSRPNCCQTIGPRALN